MQHNNGPVRLKKYPTLTEYGREITASAVAYRLVSESSCGPFPSLSLRHPESPSIRYHIPSQEPRTLSAPATPAAPVFFRDQKLASKSFTIDAFVRGARSGHSKLLKRPSVTRTTPLIGLKQRVKSARAPPPPAHAPSLSRRPSAHLRY
ncbi:hypothetical protein EVAR_33427_1 [Eumeta japonica]|uniref:Uncharacterized protein n=1 Tax=Eumeta variegata TaxID=151549 RepID=A0A4C1W3C4_EUMVA|nr:hypothetical protein EVAR_33427_1 [Eumeta japonica]